MARRYDLFLSYNSRDQDAVRRIHEELKRRGLNPWFDREALTPGRLWQAEAEKGIRSCRAAAVFVGSNGIGPWETEEMHALLAEAVERKIPVIPVLLPGAKRKPKLPVFLGQRTWVDLHGGITPDGLAELVRGITPTKKQRNPSAKPLSLGPPLHNLPYPPLGDLLKGRDEELRKLSESLEAGGSTAIVQHRALYGLGGIGKTRLAIEYAWASGSRYRAAFFVRADTPEGLRTGLAALARTDLLNLGEGMAEEKMVHAVLGWLKTNPGWLLILDNVDTQEAESEVLGLVTGLTGGRVLITSRRQGWPPWVRTQPLDTIPREEARDFLLKRTNGRRHEAPDDADRARDLAEKLDGLPLALDQAGAYISHTRLSFAEYLKVWEEERQRALEWHDRAVMSHPTSVATTWKASFDRLKPTAATLLRLCAFLAPEPIPKRMFEWEREVVEDACELLRSETRHSDDIGSVREALAELESYSLISRQEEATFTVHRVVQDVLQSRVPPERLKDWIEVSLKIVNGYAPLPADDVRTWPVWSTLRPHAARIVYLADQAGLVNPTSRLMNELGAYLDSRDIHAEAEPLKRRALAIDEAVLGGNHPDVARDLNNLAQLLQATNRSCEAEPLMRRALAIDEASFGSDHPEVAIDLNNLAQLLQAANRLCEAEPLMRRALAIDEGALGSDHPKVAIRLHNLAMLLLDTNRLSEAEPLIRRALEIDEASFGSEHPDVAIDLKNLALLLEAANRLFEAEPLLRRALAINQASFGSEHPIVAIDLNNLAQLLQDTNRLSEAEPLMRQAVEILERSLGPDHPNTRIVQGNLAALLAEIDSRSSPPPAPGGGDSV